MSTADPFNIVKEELKRSINKTKSLIESYNVVSNGNSDETGSKLLTDIRTNLKSINWDVQDLEETINIASKNPAKFNLSVNDIESRRQFISQTKDFVQRTKNTYQIEFTDDSIQNSSAKKSTPNQQNKSNNSNKGKWDTSNINIRIPDLISNATAKRNDYSRLNTNDESDYELDTRRVASDNRNNDQNNFHSIQMQHEELFKEQDKNLELISNRVSSLKNISQTMQNELDSQAVLLEDLGREMDSADSRMNNVMKKITKVLHMTNDRRQWTMIGVLLVAILIIIILLAVL